MRMAKGGARATFRAVQADPTIGGNLGGRFLAKTLMIGHISRIPEM
jgi:hypothetical protein